MNEYGGASRDRGQTLQDFTIGISLFILTVSGVFTSLFLFTNPFWTGVSGEEISQSDRIAETIIRTHETGDTPNELDSDSLKSGGSAVFSVDDSVLATRWGVQDGTLFNVTVETLDSSAIVEEGGDALETETNYHGQEAAISTRIITLSSSDGDDCDPACRLVVRVW